MNCKEVREQASAYLDQEMGPADAAELEQHLVGCVDCRQEIETLRKTVSLVGGLGPIETSTNFLGKVHEKIERGAKPRRIWAWLFEPLKIKVPLEIAGLLLVSTMTLYFYFKSPELSRESGVPVALEGFKVARDEPKKKAPANRGKNEESYRTVESETKPKVLADLKAKASKRKSSLGNVERTGDEVVASPRGREATTTNKRLQDAQVKPREQSPERGGKDFERYEMAGARRPEKLRDELSKPMGTEKIVSEGTVSSAPKPEIHEVVVDNVADYEKKVQALLAKVDGRLLVRGDTFEPGLLLTVEFPQSRQGEFIAALKDETQSEATMGQLKRGFARDFKEDIQEKDAIRVGKPSEIASEPSPSSQLRADEPRVTLQIRILPKK